MDGLVHGDDALYSSLIFMDPTIAADDRSITGTDVCPNCDRMMDGEFCSGCGQKRVDHHEFAIGHFFSHLLHEFTHLDSNKIFRTLAHLITKPGLLAREYLDGRKGRYINPIRVYLTVSALYFLFAWGALGSAGGGGVENTARRPNFIAIANRKGVDPHVLAEKAHEKAGKYSAILRFASVLVSGLFLTILYYRSGKYYVEHLIFSLYFYSFDFLCKCVVALFYLTEDYTGSYAFIAARTLYYITAFVYLFLALLRVYDQPWPTTLIKSVALFVLEVSLFVAVNIAGFFLVVAFI